jgi:hypothetical protein
MAIHLDYNPYHGINAHYQSLLQNIPGGWRPFHSKYVVLIANTLNQTLPAGYFALEEQSIQIQIPPEVLRTVRPDISIYRSLSPTSGLSSASTTITPTLEVSASEAVPPEEDYLTAIHIYHTSAKQADQLVTSIEILSPTNKVAPEPYLEMRAKTLYNGVRMVEVDYLHETPNLFRHIVPDYSKQEEGAYPYAIVITDPTPIPDKPSGVTRFYAFHVEDTIPVLPIPLLDGESVTLNFGEVYNQAYANDRRAHLKIDYAEEPIHLDRYTPADQQRIRERMEAIRQQVPET